MWWCMSLVPALGRQRQMDDWVVASPFYRVSSRAVRAIQRNPVSKEIKKS